MKLILFLYHCVAAQPVKGLSELDRRVGEAKAQAWALSSWNTKLSQWRKYLRFCFMFNLEPLPTTVQNLCRYVVYLSSSLKFSSIDNYVSGVISLNNYFGHEARSLRLDFQFILTMRGVRRILGDPTPYRPTLLFRDLILMFTFVDMDDVNQRSMWAAIVLCFRSLLRKCNVVPVDRNDPGVHVLRRSSVSFQEWGILVNVSSSKTVQYNQRVLEIPIAYANNHPLDAASLLALHYQDFPSVPQDAPLFWVYNRNGYCPLTYRSLLKFFKLLLVKSGLPSDEVGLHSLRRAGALFMYETGSTLDEVRQAGDWKSMAALVYLTKPFRSKLSSETRFVKRMLSHGV